MRRQQTGTTTVEFAIVGALLLTITLAVIEFGRALFTWSMLNEGTRRGARLAVVCPINDPDIATETIFVALPNLTSANVAVEYLAQNGSIITDPNGAFTLIRFVRVRITNYQHQLVIPFVDLPPLMIQPATTLPRESLGIPREGEVAPC